MLDDDRATPPSCASAIPGASLLLRIRPSELIAALKLKKKIKEWKRRAEAQTRDADWVFCFEILNKVSRSFAIVIEQLGDELRNAVCVFYLVLRGLDTVSSRLEPAPAPLPGMIWIQKPELDAG